MHYKTLILACTLGILSACATTSGPPSMYPHCLYNSDCNPNEVCKRQLCTANLAAKKEKHLKARSTQPVAVKKTTSVTLAVMGILDDTGLFDKDTLGTATVFLRSSLAGSGITLAMDSASQGQDKSIVRQYQKESHKARYDTAYQVELGKALSAGMVLKSTVRRFGDSCSLTGEVLDVTRETVAGIATANFNCTEKGLSSAINAIAPQVRRKMCK